MRAPRFSLRLLFILTTLCAAVLGYIVCFEAPCHNPRQQEQEQIVDELTSLRLDLANFGLNLGGSTWEMLPSPPFAKMLGRKQGRRLTGVHLWFDTQVSDDLEQMASLMERIDQESDIETIKIEFGCYHRVNGVFYHAIPRRTTHLQLHRVEINQSDLDTIAGLRHLKAIELSEISFESDDFQKSLRMLISNLPTSVAELSFGGLDIPVEVAEVVGARSSIESLEISSCNFISADDYPIVTLPTSIIGPHCKRLKLRSMMIDRPLCEQIARCKNLQRLDIYNCIFDGSDYQTPISMVVENLPTSLEELMLPRFSLSQNDLQSLAKLKSLRELTLTYDGTEVSKDDIRRLSKSLTKLELETDIPEQWLAALVDHPQFEEISIHTDRTLPDTICDVILKVNPKKFIYSGRMLSAKARQRLLDARVDDNGSDDEYPSFGSSGGW